MYYAELLNSCQRNGIPLHFDSTGPEHASRLYSFIQDQNRMSLHDIGCTLPGRWRRSIADADLTNRLGLNVRVVKGQWKDPQAPDLDARAGYMQVIRQLAGKARCVRVATHDLSLATAALTCLLKQKTYCELELLYGLPMEQLVSLAERLNVPVRIYVAFGHPYLPYALSGLRKNPKMILPLVKEAFRRDYLLSIPVCSTNNLSSC